MNQTFAAAHKTTNLIPSGLTETIWETLIALAMAAAVCVGVVNLAAHLESAGTARMAVADKPADNLVPSSFASGYEALDFANN